MDVREVPIDTVLPYEGNPRKNAAAVADVAKSIAEFGWRAPIVVDEAGVILAGHTRLEAAKRLGLATVPVHVAAGLTEAQARAYRLMDNRSAENAEWDSAKLQAEIDALLASDFDLGLTGFTGTELNALAKEVLGDAGPADDDGQDVIEPPSDPVSFTGCAWQMGAHRLRCGDSTNAEDVASLLAGAVPHLMVTDPPYGVKYDPEWRDRVMRTDGSKVGSRSKGKVANDDRADWREAWALFPGLVAYVWHGALHTAAVAESLAVCDFVPRCQIIWAKQQLVIGRGDYHWQHEPCWYAVKKGKPGKWAGDRKQTSVWQIDAPTGWRQKTDGEDAHTGVHSTQKPVECMRRPMLNSSKPGDAVYEPFMGSGSSLIAAESCGRVCYGMELNPAYVDLAVLRWQRLTGKTAILEGDGRTYDEVAAARKAA